MEQENESGEIDGIDDSNCNTKKKKYQARNDE